MALSAAYFVGEIHVPNISGSTVTETANLLQLQIAIAKHEPVILKWILGTDFYTDYAAGLAEVSPEQRWTDLESQLYQQNETLNIGISPAANYVYFKFCKSQNSNTLVNGEGKASSENFGYWSSTDKLVNAWNEMITMIEEIQAWILENINDYPECDTNELGYFDRINQFGI